MEHFICSYFKDYLEYCRGEMDPQSWWTTVGSAWQLIYGFLCTVILAIWHIIHKALECISITVGCLCKNLKVEVWQMVIFMSGVILLLFTLYTCSVRYYAKRRVLLRTRRGNNAKMMQKALCDSILTHKRTIFVTCVLLSIPWEYMRLYLHQYAAQAAITLKGMPEECMPGKMSYMSSFRSGLSSLLSWSHDPCIEYHKALLVDPFWEISPLTVISSLFARCVCQPLIVVSEMMPTALRNVFAELPAQWQPVFALMLFLSVLLCLVTISRYEIHLPFVRLKPSLPACIRCCSRRASGDFRTEHRNSDIKPRQSLKG